MNSNFSSIRTDFDLAQASGRVFQLREVAFHTYQGRPTQERFEQAQREHQAILQAIDSLTRQLAELKEHQAKVKRNLEDASIKALRDARALTHPDRLGTYEFSGALVAVNPGDRDGFAILVDGQGDPIVETARDLTKNELGEAMRGIQESSQLSIDDVATELKRSVVVETSGTETEIPF